MLESLVQQIEILMKILNPVILEKIFITGLAEFELNFRHYAIEKKIFRI